MRQALTQQRPGGIALPDSVGKRGRGRGRRGAAMLCGVAGGLQGAAPLFARPPARRGKSVLCPGVGAGAHRGHTKVVVTLNFGSNLRKTSLVW